MSMELIMKYFFVVLFCGISFYIGWVVRDAKYYNDLLKESQKKD